MEQRATAIAIATFMVAAGFSVAPTVTASHNDCHEDFEIADSESAASDRPLGDSAIEIGHTDVSSTEKDKTLHVELRTVNDMLDWEVFVEDPDCQSYSSACEGTLDKEGQEQTCTLASPSSEVVRDYWVVYENVGDDALDYRTWAN